MCTSEKLALPGVRRHDKNSKSEASLGWGGRNTEKACTVPLTGAVDDTYLGRVAAHLFHHFRHILGMCHQTLAAARRRIYRHEHLTLRMIFKHFSPVDPA